MMKRLPGCFIVCFLLAASPSVTSLSQTAEKRVLNLDDLATIRTVRDPQVSPEGNWVAYTVRTLDMKEDKRNSHIWMTSWDGARSLQLTSSKDSESAPRWSPDGQYLAFLSDRGGDEIDQVWLMNRAGGEAERITDLKGGVEEFAWSPDSKRLALVVKDPDPEATDSKDKEKDKDKKTPKPIVIDRFQFKLDETGYLNNRRQHIFLLDLKTRKAEALTPGNYDEAKPAWSPDGSTIAFVSKRGPDPDRTNNFDIYLIEPKVGATARQLTTFKGADSDPDWESGLEWSPDGKSIAYVQGGAPELIYYAVHQVAVIAVAGGQARLVASSLDRNMTRPHWSADGSSIYFVLEDDRSEHLARVSASGGAVERVASGHRVVGAFDVNATGKLAFLSSTPNEPNEVFALEGREFRRITHQNDELFLKLKLSALEEISFKSKDGTAINGFLVKPPDYQAGRRYPTILRIHGGPVSQFDNAFFFEWQMLAARGYVVVAANPRGSSGRGEAFAKAIWADWGNKDAQDVLAAVDYAVAQGIADPARLGVGGWSYGGMLTNYTIAQDTRFKAACSGAGTSNILAGYGTDQYIREYEAELGTPWANPAGWMKVSFPFLHADRIVTPTLFLCGDKDFNVPLLNSEQMYQALRSLGRDTQLVIYPGQFHEIVKPTYQRDRVERYLAWYDKYLMPKPAGEAANPARNSR
ncbi:MAG TPA: S9 family peptidase [Blastocatellia bacterium]|nr:S9 family peptidase [Blastocatellia bacterium]